MLKAKEIQPGVERELPGASVSGMRADFAVLILALSFFATACHNPVNGDSDDHRNIAAEGRDVSAKPETNEAVKKLREMK